MKIFVDENIPLLTVKILREKGHDVLVIDDLSGGFEDNVNSQAIFGK